MAASPGMSTSQRSSAQGEGQLAPESRSSLTPLLPGAFPTSSTPSSSNESESAPASEAVEGQSKPRKRDFWKLGKKVEEGKTKGPAKTPPLPGGSEVSPGPRPAAPVIAPVAALRPKSPLRSQDQLRGSVSPQRSHPYGIPGSPSQGMYSSSPRAHSPASSQIFERDVQEDVVPSQASPQIPSHIITENHIPPALDASSEAITNAKLDPDSVEIVTHATHQPASVTITGSGPEPSTAPFLHDDLAHSARNDTDNASNYGSLDAHDVRRLSFISFADVVNAEHAGHAEEEQRRDSVAAMGLSSNPALTAPRSPSPLRSPVSSHRLSTSPPTSMSASVQGLESSPNRGLRGAGSSLPGQPGPLGGELNIETMRQALRKTGSGDLSGFRSQPVSAIGNDDGSQVGKSFK